MTREEALEYFKNKTVVLTEEEALANLLAIKALEQSPTTKDHLAVEDCKDECIDKAESFKQYVKETMGVELNDDCTVKHSNTMERKLEDCISRKAVQIRLKEIITEMETIFADIREKEVDDSVCGLCEYDCDHGLDGFANECPGFEKDDCFKLNEKYKAEWLDISNLPNVTPKNDNSVLEDIRAEIAQYTDPQGFINISEGRLNEIIDKYCRKENTDGSNNQ